MCRPSYIEPLRICKCLGCAMVLFNIIYSLPLFGRHPVVRAARRFQGVDAAQRGRDHRAQNVVRHARRRPVHGTCG